MATREKNKLGGLMFSYKLIIISILRCSIWLLWSCLCCYLKLSEVKPEILKLSNVKFKSNSFKHKSFESLASFLNETKKHHGNGLLLD